MTLYALKNITKAIIILVHHANQLVEIVLVQTLPIVYLAIKVDIYIKESVFLLVQTAILKQNNLFYVINAILHAFNATLEHKIVIAPFVMEINSLMDPSV